MQWGLMWFGIGLACIVQAQAFSWELLDLAHPDLKAVAEALQANDEASAGNALLEHWRSRQDSRDAWSKAKSRKKPSAFDQKLADDALEHRFYAHAAYQPSAFYGKDIDWTVWPVRADELRFQLHRHKWFMPLLKVYAATGDDRYFAAWREQWGDWIRKNPFPGRTAAERKNARFAWRALEISDRLSGLLRQLALAVYAPAFTVKDLKVFLGITSWHADLVWQRRAARGNHLIFEMTRLLGAAQALPELKGAAQWRANAVRVLSEELHKQVYSDGVQYELDLGYHISVYSLFPQGLCLAPEPFSPADRALLGKMAAFADDLFFPDGEHPYFADTHALKGRRTLLIQARVDFPEAFHRADFVSRAYPNGGFYVLREGSPKSGSMVVLKAGPAAFWHNQPDNGTFSYWYAGRDFFPDAGSYLYGGPDTADDRAAFRATRVHSTLTLDGQDNAPGSKLLRWEAQPAATIVIVETPAYPGLNHRRSLRLGTGGTLEITDEAYGEAAGQVEVRFCLAPGAAPECISENLWRTHFADGNDIRLAFSEGWQVDVKPGWRSRIHGKKEPRPILCLRRNKTTQTPTVALQTEITPIASGVENKTSFGKRQKRLKK